MRSRHCAGFCPNLLVFLLRVLVCRSVCREAFSTQKRLLLLDEEGVGLASAVFKAVTAPRNADGYRKGWERSLVQHIRSRSLHSRRFEFRLEVFWRAHTLQNLLVWGSGHSTTTHSPEQAAGHADRNPWTPPLACPPCTLLFGCTYVMSTRQRCGGHVSSRCTIAGPVHVGLCAQKPDASFVF